ARLGAGGDAPRVLARDAVAEHCAAIGCASALRRIAAVTLLAARAKTESLTAVGIRLAIVVRDVPERARAREQDHGAKKGRGSHLPSAVRQKLLRIETPNVPGVTVGMKLVWAFAAGFVSTSASTTPVAPMIPPPIHAMSPTS